jgi:DNA adenine methylase
LFVSRLNKKSLFIFIQIVLINLIKYHREIIYFDLMQLQLANNEIQFKINPFLRWAGGKNWFVKHAKNQLPVSFINYHEPFLGGGAVFFSLLIEQKSYLSDLNSDLIDTYIQVRDNVEKVIQQLKTFKNTESEYYKIRSKVYREPHKAAARFIYLNMTSFNGIYRVNRDGEYNVPFGHRYTIDFVQEDLLRLASTKLQKCILKVQDFEKSLMTVKANDFVFIDPPYTVAHENNGFILYNQKLFSIEDQYRLANCLKQLSEKGALFLMTNAYHHKIKEIYSGVGSMSFLNRRSLIGGKGAKRDIIREYIIKNF